MGYRLRGQEQIVRAVEDVKRAARLGCRGFLVYDEGCLWLLNEMRKAGEIPEDCHFKVSAHAGHGNPCSAKLLESIGADSINPVRDIQLQMLAAMRQAVDCPIDIHTENPKSTGGFIRHYEVPEMIRVAAPAIDEEKLAGYALRFCHRELQQKKPVAPGRRLHRYLSGITPRGNLAFVDTVAALAARVIAVADETGAVAGKLVEQIGERAIAAGYDAIFCRNPLQPNGDSEHLILPQASLAIVTQKRLHAYHFAASRTLHAQRFLRDDLLSKKRARLNFDRQLIRSLLDESIAQQQLAKQTHDQLETFYAAAMDFDALQAYTESFADSLFATALKRGAKRANA